MITIVRSANINDGKQMAATEWAVKVAAYLTESQGNPVTVMANVGGKISQLHWVVNHDSLGAMEAAMGAMMADEGYMELYTEAVAGGYFSAVGLVDNIYRSIP